DHLADRLQKAEEAGAEIINYENEDVLHRLDEMTSGRGPDSCIDAVGLEAHGNTFGAVYDQVKASLMLATDRPNVLRQCLMACRKGGTVSIPVVYGGLLDKVPFGA